MHFRACGEAVGELGGVMNVGTHIRFTGSVTHTIAYVGKMLTGEKVCGVLFHKKHRLE